MGELEHYIAITKKLLFHQLISILFFIVIS